MVQSRSIDTSSDLQAADLDLAVLQVQQFCKNYRELRSMGFDVATVVGALVLHKNDLAAATEACLSAQ